MARLRRAHHLWAALAYAAVVAALHWKVVLDPSHKVLAGGSVGGVFVWEGERERQRREVHAVSAAPLAFHRKATLKPIGIKYVVLHGAEALFSASTRADYARLLDAAFGPGAGLNGQASLYRAF